MGQNIRRDRPARVLAESEHLNRHAAGGDFFERRAECLTIGGGDHDSGQPGTATAEQVLAYRPDGIFLSNGPGDPEPLGYAIDTIRNFLKAKGGATVSELKTARPKFSRRFHFHQFGFVWDGPAQE